MSPSTPDLILLARRLFWWKEPADALRDPLRFLSQVMAIGTWEDVQTAFRHWTERDFREALQHAPAGVFDVRSWHYWHRRLCDQVAPPLPCRRLP